VRCDDQDGWVLANLLTVPEFPVTGAVVTTGLSANCRLQPTTTSLVIATLEDGTPVEITGPTIAGWVPVTCDDQAGWIFTDLIEPPPEP
jgi:SH3-like domain-containing protein